MDNKTKREVVATLLRAGRRDLAEHVVGKLKPVDMVHLEDAIKTAVLKVLKKKKLSVQPTKLNYPVQKLIDVIDRMV